MSVLDKKQIMVIGKKETFLIRVLLKKIKEAGIDAIFCSDSINDINAHWEDSSLITCYYEAEASLSDAVLRFLVDKFTDDHKQMVIIGDRRDIQHVYDNIPGEMIYKVLNRPLDAEEYINSVKDLFKKIDSGEYKKSILVVDDDPTYLGVVREWLKSTYQVAMVSSGLQAIKWLGKNKADLILLDYEMPVTDGPQVLEMLRADEETKAIPVIFLTGKSDRESVMAVLSLKPEGYFLKSIEREELLNNLKDFFLKQKR